MKPICVACRRFFRPVRNGFYFLEGMPEGNAKPGTAEPEKWKPYKLHVGDRWQCEGCKTEIIVGVPPQRLAEHYEPDFKEKVERFNATYQVNDC